MVLACINRKSPLAGAVTINGIFCVNLLAENQSAISNCFAGRSGEGPAYDFACAEWRHEVTGSPVLQGAAASFDCLLDSYHDAGTHRIVIGRVLAAAAGGSSALVYANRGYCATRALSS